MEAGGATQRGHQTPERERERETEERRAQESSERLISLLERMLKYIISHSLLAKRKQWEKMGTLQFFNILISVVYFCDVSEKLNE